MRIRVFPRREMEARPRLFKALEKAFSIEFVGCDEVDAASDEPMIALAEGDVVERGLSNSQCAWFSVKPWGSRGVSRDDQTLRFGEIPNVRVKVSHFPLVEKDFDGSGLVDPEGEGWTRALGCQQGGLWLWKRHGEQPRYRVGSAPGELGEGELLFDAIQPGRFVRLLPLAHFLKWVSERNGLESMRPMASLIIDDPNLHWPTYGHVVFKDLLAHAEKHDYHAVMAMVPLDSWRWHSGVREIFKKNPRRLSLMMHGNDHTRHELARPRSESSSLRMFAQGLRRIEAFEGRTGLRVARVMEPPFGVCSMMSLRAMQKLGYDGGLLAHDVVLETRNELWPANFGVAEVDLAVDGFPTISRRRIVADWKTGAALNLCLGQPVIVAAHHEDAAGELKQFAEVAEMINAAGEVKWCGMEELTRSLYRTRRDGNVLYVRPFCRNVVVPLERGVREIVTMPMAGGIERTVALAEDGHELGDINGLVNVNGCARITVRSVTSGQVDFQSVPEPAFSPWAYLRRALTAARDRSSAMFFPARQKMAKIGRNSE
jgi:hypothetical protein